MNEKEDVGESRRKRGGKKERDGRRDKREDEPVVRGRGPADEDAERRRSGEGRGQGCKS